MPAARRSKAKMADSPLQNPDKPIHQVAAAIQEYLYMPDPSLFYVVVGTAAGNMVKGKPIWMVLVGGSSSGKTEMLTSISGLPKEICRLQTVSTIKSIGVLLSGTRKAEIGRMASGGILKQVEPTGILLMTDMAGLLQLPKETCGEIMGAFRDIYDGHYERPIGTDGGRILNWGPGNRIGFMAASTSLIDRHAILNSQLGERWVYYRMPHTDGLGETQAALRNRDPQESQEAIRAYTTSLFSAYGLSMDKQQDRRLLTPVEEGRFFALGSLCARIRSEVPRDSYRKEQIVDMIDPERPMRITLMCTQLYLGLEVFELTEAERWPLVGKVALDSVPRLRAEVVKTIMNSIKAGVGNTIGIKNMKELLGISDVPAGIVIEDLCKLGIVRKIEQKSTGGMLALTEWAREMVAKGWGV